MSGRRALSPRWLVLLGLGLSGLAGRPAGAEPATREVPSVLVFPLEAKNAPEDVARVATEAVVDGLRDAPAVHVVGPGAAKAEAGVDLLEQARGCDYDVFCLVEVGRLFSGREVVIGTVEGATGAPRWTVKLLRLDVERAAMVDTVAYTVRSSVNALVAAAQAAGRRLCLPSNASLQFEVSPADARLSVFGEEVEVREDGTLSLWTGRWRVDVDAPGYEPHSRWVTLSAQRPRRQLHVQLRADPLYVRERPSASVVEPFERPSRRHGSGIGVEEAGKRREGPQPPGRFARPWPWIIVGTGVAAAVTGTVLMVDAQSRYEGLALEPRYVSSATSADAAHAERDQLRDLHLAGSLAAVAGGIAVSVGLAWLLFVDPPRERRLTVAEATNEVSAGPERQKAARELARSLRGGPR